MWQKLKHFYWNPLPESRVTKFLNEKDDPETFQITRHNNLALLEDYGIDVQGYIKACEEEEA